MARRIPLPRLTRRQRMARWQRERRQKLIYLAMFSTFLFFALGLVGWAAAGKYYDENLKPAARLDGRAIPLRDFNKRLAFERTRFFVDIGVPEGGENDPQLRGYVAQLRKGALGSVVEGELLLEIAREQGRVPSAADVQARVERDFRELHVRHILVKPDEKADEKVADKTQADADAKSKATDIVAKLRADPKNAKLWEEVASKESGDTGSKDKGGDLGWVNANSGFVKEFENAMYALGEDEISDPVKSTFGYHVIQRLESRPLTQTPLYARLRKAGIGTDDLATFARGVLLKERYEKEIREAEIPSSQEQVHLAVVAVHMPPPQQSQAFLEALKKIQQVLDAIEKSKDFAAVAKEQSDDAESKEKGGDIGWFTKSMLQSRRTADHLFSLEVGQRSEQQQLPGGDIGIYKVLEKDQARALTEEQMTKIREQAYSIWFADQERRLDVLRLIPGLEF